MPLTLTVYSPVEDAWAADAVSLLAVLLTETCPLPNKNSIPLSTLPSLQAAEIKMFSSVVGSPASSSLFLAASIPLSGSFSLISTTFSVVGSIPIFSWAHFTNSGSGSQGVLPK